MSYELFCETGSLGPVATVEGWNTLVELLARGSLSSYPFLSDFLVQGRSLSPQHLTEDLRAFLSRGRLEPDVKLLVETLLTKIKSSREIIIVTG